MLFPVLVVRNMFSKSTKPPISTQPRYQNLKEPVGEFRFVPCLLARMRGRAVRCLPCYMCPSRQAPGEDKSYVLSTGTWSSVPVVTAAPALDCVFSV